MVEGMVLLALVAVLVLQVLAWRRAAADRGVEPLSAAVAALAAKVDALAPRLEALAGGQERCDRILREEAGRGRMEAASHFEVLRGVVDAKLGSIQADNAAKLEQMRLTVDEKLQGTLEKRLGESFKLVSERLELVQRGLGEMQSLANGVGDLKKVLSNVKSRGTWGEVQVGALLEQILAPEQYAMNVATKTGSAERVEFAIKLPGRAEGGSEIVWMPVDSKFPHEDWLRLQECADKADAEGVEAAGRRLEASVKASAKTIRDKYLNPPQTTDFAVLFLPTEGLYAEIARRPGLVEMLQREHRVMVAGPSNFSALLTSLQMGFRTLAISKRSSEVWKVLGTVKSEFGKFEVVLGNVKKKLDQASATIGDAEVRTRAIQRSLRDVESLPAAAADEYPAELWPPAISS